MSCFFSSHVYVCICHLYMWLYVIVSCSLMFAPCRSFAFAVGCEGGVGVILDDPLFDFDILPTLPTTTTAPTPTTTTTTTRTTTTATAVAAATTTTTRRTGTTTLQHLIVACLCESPNPSGWFGCRFSSRLIIHSTLAEFCFVFSMYYGFIHF